MWGTFLRSPLRLLLLFALLLLLFLSLVPKLVVAELVLEPGYAVSTVLDFNKPLRGLPPAAAAIHPFTLLPHARVGDLLLLDSCHSGSAFYSLPVPVYQDAGIALFSGKGGNGFSDGDQTEAVFNQPRSFAVDDGGNVYVEDRRNFAIRKISSSGVTTTIAGGFSEKRTGHIDGPAQNATFSNDFDLVYVPKICALLISDRGNGLIRQINLKPADCVHKSQSGFGAAPVSIIAVLCGLLGMILGFVARPFFAPREVSINRFINQTWRHYRANLKRLVLMTYYDIKRGVANSAPFVLIIKLIKSSLCFLYIVFRNLTLEKQVQCREPVSLLDSDVTTNCSMMQSQVIADQFTDLISFDEHKGVVEVSNTSLEQETVKEGALESSLCRIDGMINTNLFDFADQTEHHHQMGGGFSNEGMVKRRPRGGDRL